MSKTTFQKQKTARTANRVLVVELLLKRVDILCSVPLPDETPDFLLTRRTITLEFSVTWVEAVEQLTAGPPLLLVFLLVKIGA